MKKIILVTIAIYLYNMQVFAVDKYWRGNNSNDDWTNANNWTTSTGANTTVPGTGDNVFINAIGATAPGSITVLYNPEAVGTSNCLSVTFNSGSYLKVTTSLNVYGDFINNSTNIDVITGIGGNGYVKFRGSSTATVSGDDIDFGIVEINKTSSGSVTLNSSYDFTISNYLYLNTNSLVTNNKLTFLATYDSGGPSWNTAYISKNGTGTITGNVTMQQRLEDSDDSKFYHWMGSPIYTSGSPDYWSTTMLEDNTVGSDDHGTGSWIYGSEGTVPDWLFYDETPAGSGANEYIKSSYGYMDINPLWSGGTTDNYLEIMQGCLGRFEAISNLLDWTGIPNSGYLTSPNLTYTNHSQQFDGANLLGNPYPSPLDLGSVYSNNNPAEISKFFYVFQNGGTEYSGTMQVFDADIYDGDFDGIIAIGQGFLTLTLDNNVTLNMDDVDRYDSEDDIFRREQLTPSSFKIKLKTTQGNSDLTSVFYGNYSPNFIKNEDAPKIFGPDINVNAVYSKSGINMIALNYLPETSSKSIIPLEVRMQNQGQITLTSFKFNVNKSDYILIFEDRKYGRFVNFDADFEYSTVCKEGLTEGRFFIHTIASGYEDKIITQISSINSYYSNGKIMVQSQSNTNEQVLVQIIDVSGRIILSDKFTLQGLNTLDASQFSKGIYNITLTYDNGNIESQKLVINN
jgi:hypothetical protein